jgi:hypothetical protein
MYIVCYIDDIFHLLSCLINTIYEYHVDFYSGHVEKKYLDSMFFATSCPCKEMGRKSVSLNKGV